MTRASRVAFTRAARCRPKARAASRSSARRVDIAEYRRLAEASALLLGYSLGLMGIISPYATGPSPIYYGCGYISRTDFWRLGLIFGVIFLIVLLVVGVPYLTLFPPA